MIQIIDTDYIDQCSCCERETKIVKCIDSIYSAIDFCEDCWEELKDIVMKEINESLN